MIKIEWIVLSVIFLFIIIRIKKRGFFWRDRRGKKISLKQFTSKWKEGIINITPLQQTQITLWSFIPMFTGMIWGIVATLMGGLYWMSLILCGSLPITSIQFISNIQKFRAQKKAKEMMDEAMGIAPEPKSFRQLKKEERKRKRKEKKKRKDKEKEKRRNKWSKRKKK